MSLTDQCYQKSIALLRANSTKYGVLACGPSKVAEERNYLSVFGRDASICSLGIVLSGDRELIKSAKASLETLAKNQNKNGQIPTYVKPLDKKASYWYTSSLDSTLWWLLAIDFFDKNTKRKVKLKEKYKRNVERAIGFLEARQNPPFHLLEHNEAADWADIMPRSGYVLNANVLWYSVKNVYKIDSAEETKKHFNYLFDQSSSLPAKIKKENSRFTRVVRHVARKKNFKYYLSFVNYAQYPKNEDIDVFGNLLAIFFDLSNATNTKKFIDYARKEKIDEKLLVKVSLKPIERTSRFWRDYMKRHNQNLPHKYHNGGIWPFVGAFWVIALYKAGYQEEAQDALEKLASTNKKGNWAFNEWFHGKSGRAMGKADQSWNAGMYIYAYKFLSKK